MKGGLKTTPQSGLGSAETRTKPDYMHGVLGITEDFLQICVSGFLDYALRDGLLQNREFTQCADFSPHPPHWPPDSQDSSKAKSSILFLAVSVAAGQLTSLIKNINKARYSFIYLYEKVTFLPFSPRAHSAC